MLGIKKSWSIKMFSNINICLFRVWTTFKIIIHRPASPPPPATPPAAPLTAPPAAAHSAPHSASPSIYASQSRGARCPRASPRKNARAPWSRSPWTATPPPRTDPRTAASAATPVHPKTRQFGHTAATASRARARARQSRWVLCYPSGSTCGRARTAAPSTLLVVHRRPLTCTIFR